MGEITLLYPEFLLFIDNKRRPRQEAVRGSYIKVFDNSKGETLAIGASYCAVNRNRGDAFRKTLSAYAAPDMEFKVFVLRAQLCHGRLLV